MDDTIRLANTCSTCKYSAFKTSYHTGKKQLGICMLHTTTGVEPTRPSEGKLYRYVVENKRMMDIHEYLTYEYSIYYDMKLQRQERLKLKATTGSLYNPDYYYSLTNVENSCSSATFFPSEKITLEEYKERYKKLEEAYDPTEDAISFMTGAAETWYRFNENFLWWEENRSKMRRCHRNTTCDSHEDVSRREPVARAVANGKHKLEW